MCVMNDRNLTLLTDFYELTMGNGYLETGLPIPCAALTFISEKFPITAALRLCADWSRL